MTPEEILQEMYDQTLVGNGPRVLELTHQALELKMEPQSLLFDSLIPALEEVGARFERGDFFVPEMLIAGRAMAGAMANIMVMCDISRCAAGPSNRSRTIARLTTTPAPAEAP